jgi:hypothetical protein
MCFAQTQRDAGCCRAGLRKGVAQDSVCVCAVCVCVCVCVCICVYVCVCVCVGGDTLIKL